MNRLQDEYTTMGAIHLLYRISGYPWLQEAALFHMHVISTCSKTYSNQRRYMGGIALRHSVSVCCGFTT